MPVASKHLPPARGRDAGTIGLCPILLSTVAFSGGHCRRIDAGTIRQAPSSATLAAVDDDLVGRTLCATWHGLRLSK